MQLSLSGRLCAKGYRESDRKHTLSEIYLVESLLHIQSYEDEYREGSMEFCKGNVLIQWKGEWIKTRRDEDTGEGGAGVPPRC